MRLVIVSGLSGSGKSVALHALEDAGYYCIHNVPLELLEAFVTHMESHRDTYRAVAVGVDVRSVGPYGDDFPNVLERLRGRGIDLDLIFLQAQRDILLKRYSETRRRHPLSQEGLPLDDALDVERARLGPVIAEADLVLDTTHSNVHTFRHLFGERVLRDGSQGLSLLFQSFGFKHGVPLDSDFLFDVRCLPNPHWLPELRGRTGLDSSVAGYLCQFESVQTMVSDLVGLLEHWLPQFQQENRSYLTVSIGCTGGYHRSVFIAQRLYEYFVEDEANLAIRHRELS